MKYKDRRHTKHKYKQVLLAAVTTTTVGISTLGSTTSIFAEEKEKNAVQQQNTVQQKISDKYYERGIEMEPLAQFDNWTQNLAKNTGAANYKNTLSLAEKTLPILYKDLKKGNFSNTARSLLMFGTALIPYGGAFISPVLGLLWPENVEDQKNQLQALRKELTTLMDQKIEDYDVATLKQQTKALINELRFFEDSVNGKYAKSPAVGGTIQETRRILAITINSKFKDLIELCEKEKQQVAELPTYTIVAAAHLEFLRFIEVNGKDPNKIHIDDETLKSNFVNQIPEFTDRYITHIQKTYTEGEQQFLDKMNDITTHSVSESENLRYLKSLDNPRDEMGYTQDKIDKIKQNIKDYEKYSSAKHTFMLNTISSLAYKTMLLTGWKQEGNKYYYLDKNNMKRTGWFIDGDQKYYLSPEKTGEFEKGEMVTGLINIKNTSDSPALTYYFNPEKGKKQGTLMMGWIKNGDNWYYASPRNGTKNWDNKSFDRGVLVTGWVKIDNEYYYFSPADGTKNDDGKEFKKGEMVTGWMNVNGAWYYLNTEKTYGLIGHMLHDQTASVKNKNGEYKQHRFNENGTLAW
ncbi:hypothetical protein BK720_08025 [Bacillus thuringiensis serovar brasilensis]|uniref:insecticidal delta-endotoxin Cry8Ea1 family protein n=1 Tax=Bacillus cereus group TaxID=86661 RepID=UPI000A38CD61|nr:insecticidal delta-endotoxin Cry8Ea1 family protein [Bacillus thuringiensis]MCU5031440.1 insecticidal delta-endotoxin Cry8Ea1 family protein [Bacillus cereus]MRA74171.1 hypothetical protein [Bacillus thuringiensis]MRA92719.1 hypothetical protein [Bacillus thuringiensis]MRC55335.1 hypothetical protein [Bacillus thuringiensis]OTX35223.1 hypothetical protein BK720_08025 [Bacillus thuringiensis serovar brasilensis]